MVEKSVGTLDTILKISFNAAAALFVAVLLIKNVAR